MASRDLDLDLDREQPAAYPCGSPGKRSEFAFRGTGS